MKFLSDATNSGDPTPYFDAEVARIDELRAAGTILEVWVKTDYSGAFLLMEAVDEAAARAALDTMPLVQNGIATAALTPVATLDEVTAAS